MQLANVTRRHSTLLFLLAVACGLSGCGGAGEPDTYPVTGVVTYNGQPVVGANVTFYPTEGRPGMGVTNEAGEFSLETVAGDHKVTVAILPPMPGEITSEDAYDPPSEEAEEGAIPTVYANSVQTPLSEIVSADGENRFTFDLVDQ